MHSRQNNVLQIYKENISVNQVESYCLVYGLGVAILKVLISAFLKFWNFWKRMLSITVLDVVQTTTELRVHICFKQILVFAVWAWIQHTLFEPSVAKTMTFRAEDSLKAFITSKFNIYVSTKTNKAGLGDIKREVIRDFERHYQLADQKKFSSYAVSAGCKLVAEAFMSGPKRHPEWTLISRKYTDQTQLMQAKWCSTGIWSAIYWDCKSSLDVYRKRRKMCASEVHTILQPK